MSNKCIVYGCLNHKHQGAFIGDLCMPCHNMLTSGEVKYGETFVHGLRDRIEELEGMLPEDNRPCSTDMFLVTVYDEIDDPYDMREAIKCWIEGAWAEAVEGTTLAELKGQNQ